MNDHIFILGLFLLVFVGFFTIEYAFAENKIEYINSNSEIKNGLNLTLSTDKTSYFSGVPIHIKWTAENTGLEDILYTISSTTPGCDDGFRLSLITDADKIDSSWFRPAGVLLIPPDDIRHKKFDDDVFYGKILSMIEFDEPGSYGIIMFVADKNKDKIENLLKTKHNATSISGLQTLSFVTAQVPVEEIPKLADYDIIGRIGDGEERVCNESMGKGTLSAGKSSEGGYSWSQQIFHRNFEQEIMSSGNYTVQLSFANVKTSVEIFIGDQIPSPIKQLKQGFSLDEITCKGNLKLIFKTSDNSPACVKPTTIEKLIVRGWARI